MHPKIRFVCLLVALTFCLPCAAFAGEGRGLLREKPAAAPQQSTPSPLAAEAGLPAPSQNETGTRHATLQRQGDDYLFTLTLPPEEEHLRDYNLYLYVLKQEEDGGYRYVYAAADLARDEQGRALYDGTLLVGSATEGGETRQYLAPAVLMNRDGDEDRYRLRSLLAADHGLLSVEYQQAQMTLVVDRSTGESALMEVSALSEDPQVLAGFDPMDYDYAMFVSNTRLPTWDAQGNLLTFYDWAMGELGIGFDAYLDEHLRFGLIHVEDWDEGGFYALLEWYDDKNDIAYPVSDLIPLAPRKL